MQSPLPSGYAQLPPPHGNVWPHHQRLVRQAPCKALAGLAWKANVIVRGESMVNGSEIRLKTISTLFPVRTSSIAGVVLLGTQPRSLSANQQRPAS